MHGLNVHRAVLENKEKESGCTVHYVTAAVNGTNHYAREDKYRKFKNRKRNTRSCFIKRVGLIT